MANIEVILIAAAVSTMMAWAEFEPHSNKNTNGCTFYSQDDFQHSRLSVLSPTPFDQILSNVQLYVGLLLFLCVLFPSSQQNKQQRFCDE